MWCIFLAVLSPKLNVICPFYIGEDNNQVGGSKKYCPFYKDIGFYGFYSWKVGVFVKIRTKNRTLQKSVRIPLILKPKIRTKSILFQKSIHKSVRVAALHSPFGISDVLLLYYHYYCFFCIRIGIRHFITIIFIVKLLFVIVVYSVHVYDLSGEVWGEEVWGRRYKHKQIEFRFSNYQNRNNRIEIGK